MSARPGTAAVLGLRQLNRALLARQSLLERSAHTPVQMAERLVGLQAQAPNPPYLGLWTRLREFALEDLSRALRERSMVRATMMRGTLHLVSAQDYRSLRPALQPTLQRLALASGHARALRGLDLALVRRAGAQALAAGPLTASALGQALQAHWPGHDTAELARLVRSAEPLVHVPPAGLWDEHRAAAFATAADWLGASIADAPEPAQVDALLLRYFAAFGPASAQDAAVWSGLTGVAACLRRLRPQLCSFRDERGVELFDLADAPRPPADTPAPPRLLPEFDNVLLAHADRARILDPAQRAAVFSRNGLVAATVLVNGFVRGTWRVQRESGQACLTIAPWQRLPKDARSALEEEAAACLRTMAPSARHEVRFAPVAG